ncbi:SDR family NAD(P)-dependent oxidoreductase [Ferrovibrio sp.]|uniref:SDR family NAD(P)-dependent oxidoreductase n=1 Tax=Ferrovibrio sp. TaxID=1917215 RepID=UPI0035B12D72
MSSAERVAGKVVLVTGGTAGIGLEIARRLAELGARVVILGRDAARTEAAAANLPRSAGSLPGEYLVADLSQPAAQARAIAEIEQRWPDLAILVNNAGMQVNMASVGIGDDGCMAALRSEVELNLMAPIALSLGLMPLLARQPAAAIVNISSGLALAPKRSAPVYCATKAGLRVFSTALRYRCADAAPNIRVIDAVMAYVDTALTRGRGGVKMAAADAAAEVVAGMLRGTTEIWVGKTRLLRWAHRLWPNMARNILRNS